MTGQLYVALDYFPNTAVHLAQRKSSVPEISVVPSTLEQVTARMEKNVDQLSRLPVAQVLEGSIRVMTSVETVIRSPEISQTLEDIRQLVARLDRAVAATQKDLGTAAAAFQATSDSTRTALGTVSRATTQLSGKLETDLDALHTLVTSATSAVGEVHQEIVPLATTIQNTADASRALVVQARRSLGALEGTLNGTSPVGAQAPDALHELDAAPRSLQTLADYLDEHPEALLYGKRAER